MEQYCRGRRRVRFVHVAPWPGYKAGACNLALRRYTDPRAEVIGLVEHGRHRTARVPPRDRPLLL